MEIIKNTTRSAAHNQSTFPANDNDTPWGKPPTKLHEVIQTVLDKVRSEPCGEGVVIPISGNVQVSRDQKNQPISGSRNNNRAQGVKNQVEYLFHGSPTQFQESTHERVDAKDKNGSKEKLFPTAAGPSQNAPQKGVQAYEGQERDEEQDAHSPWEIQVVKHLLDDLLAHGVIPLVPSALVGRVFAGSDFLFKFVRKLSKSFLLTKRKASLRLTLYDALVMVGDETFDLRIVEMKLQAASGLYQHTHTAFSITPTDEFGFA